MVVMALLNLLGDSGNGGLLIIYGNSIINDGTISSNGASPVFKWSGSCSAGGGGSGGGSINLFYNSYLKKGNISASGGSGYSGSSGTYGNKIIGYSTVYARGGSGGAGCVSYGSIASGSYVADP